MTNKDSVIRLYLAKRNIIQIIRQIESIEGQPLD